MIPQVDHQLLWNMARRGAPIEVKINKVPGSIRLNNFVHRQGRIVDLKPCSGRGPFRIERVVVRLFSVGFGSKDICVFPVEHITLMTSLKPSLKPLSLPVGPPLRGYHTPTIPTTPSNDNGPMTPLQHWQTPQPEAYPETPYINDYTDDEPYDEPIGYPESYEEEQ